MFTIQILKYFQARRVVIHGKFELVIKKVQGEYHTRHHRMRSYRNVALDLIGCFEECQFNHIPILQNDIADSLATSIGVFKIPMYPNSRHEIEVKHKPYVPNNLKNWQVFEDYKQIQSFINLNGYFDGFIIDEDNMLLEGYTLSQECMRSHIYGPKEIPHYDVSALTEGDVGNENEEDIGP